MDEKPPLEPTLRALAHKARRDLGDHPTPEELVAYRSGGLTPPDEERIKDHLALCRDCSQLLLDLKEFEEDGPEEESGLSDAQVEAAWRRLRPRLEERKVLTSRRWFTSLRVAYGLAAALFVCTVGLSVWGVGLQRRLDRASEPKVNPAILDLYAEDEVHRGNEEKKVPSIGSQEATLFLYLPRDAAKYSEYEVVIATAKENGEVRFQRRSPGTETNQDVFTLELPQGALPPGQYWIRLFGIEGTRPLLLGRYNFEIVSSS